MKKHKGGKIKAATTVTPVDGIVRDRKWPFSIVTTLWVVGSFALSSVLVGVILGILKSAGVNFALIDQNVYGTFVSAGVYILLLAITLGAPRIFKLWSSRISYRKLIGITESIRWRDIGFAAVGFVVYLALTVTVQMIVAKLAPGFDPNQTQDLPFSKILTGNNAVLVFLALVIMAPVAEEIIFRGYLFGTLRRTTPVWVAALITSVVFGVVHLQLNVGLDVFVLSLVSCFLRFKTGSLWPSILIHMTKNALAFYLVYIAANL